MYLPKSKYKGGQYTPGQEYIIPGEIDAYVGPYFTTFKGAAYTGAEPSTTSVRLEPLPEKENPTGFNSPVTGEVIFYEEYDLLRNNKSEFDLRSTLPVPTFYPTPVVKDYEKGNLVRYFVRDKTTKRLQEVSSTVYKSIKSKKAEYYYPRYDILELQWNLSTVRDNIYTLARLSVNFPELKQYLKDPSQFVK